MRISDFAMYRPVSAVVLSILLVLFGVVGFNLLPVREMPDVESPVVSVGTSYGGSASSIIETQITRPIEDELNGIDGIDYIWSSSWDGWSGINIAFKQGHDMLEAVSDVRDAVSRARNRLPDDANEPVVRKSNSEGAPMMWLNLASSKLDRVELSDYAQRVLIERLSLLPGVSAINTSGVVERVLYIELDPTALAVRGLTTNDVVNALHAENIQLPAGYIRNKSLNLVVRMERLYQQAEDFSNLKITEINATSVLLSDLANIYVGAKSETTTFKANNVDSLGLGIVAMSKSNPLDVSKEVNKALQQLQHFLPEGTTLQVDFDSTVFIDAAINEVYKTLLITALLVIATLYLFLGRLSATIIPALTVPISLIAAFSVAYLFGYTINLITLMALILAIGLVVDDAIVVVENIIRHRQQGESPMMAAFKGAKELNFAVIATTVVLVMVFLPLIFVEGQIGDLFTEFAIVLSAAVIFSSILALTIVPVLAERLFGDTFNASPPSRLSVAMNKVMLNLSTIYRRVLSLLLKQRYFSLLILVASFISLYYSYQAQQMALGPTEDRGVVNVYVGGTEATSYERMVKSMDQINAKLMPLASDQGPIDSLNYSAPAFGTWADHQGFFIIRLKDWSERNMSAAQVVEQIRELTHDITDVQVHPYLPSMGGNSGEPISFVVQGENYDELYEHALALQRQAEQSGLMDGVKLDYNPTTPEILVHVNHAAARELGINVSDIATTLEVFLGGQTQTRFEQKGEEYDVYLKADETHFNSANDLSQIYLRSKSGALVSLDTLIFTEEKASARGLFHFQRKKSITLKASLLNDASLGEALTYLNQQADELLPTGYTYDYSGESKSYYDNQKEVWLLFVMALFVCYLVLGAQFESFISPAVVMLTVPIGLLGGLLGILITGETFNLYSQLGLLMLIGMATKNGILIVEFANQLRDQGQDVKEAVINAAVQRLRPILMTTMTTILGAVPMLIASGAGAETRFAVGVVIFNGMLLATIVTLFIVPSLYALIGQFSHSPQARVDALDNALNRTSKIT
ncbi:multidrug transporter AcrB [Psychromonas marina]|uniref:Multidrug transporter AcrB n=1 Tax=Psychromonas marina TaxID=88364 RepID=A0ABQ6E3X3_9GAMM|nr:efflux RND transporter permease subunit [Psychromonas marina]GLS92081.1 multidrug transporter AcrB [Psychromonas marina]